MTVIRRKNRNFNYPTSANPSDTESLHLGNSQPGSTESLNTVPAAALPRRERQSRVQPEEYTINLKNCGRKKLRRYENRTELQTLNEEDESEENGFVSIMEPYKSPFTRLLENPDALAYWNLFIEKPEEEQNRIINSNSNLRRSIRVIKVLNAKQDDFDSLCHEINDYMSERKLRAFKLMKKVEQFLKHSFENYPDQPISRHCDSHFEKRIMIAISHFHALRLEDISDHEGGYIVKVSNPWGESWSSSEYSLTDFISQMRR